MKINKLIMAIPLLALLAFSLSACGAVPVNTFAGLASDGTSLYVADQANLFSIAPGSGTIEWKYPQKADTSNLFYAVPAFGDGWVYGGTYKNIVYGIKLAGLDKANPTPAWTFNTHQDKGRIIGGLLALGKLVIVPSTDHYVYALGATDGQEKWAFKGRSAFWSQPASDGKLVYQTGMDHYLYAIDLATGSLKWEFDLGGPAIGGAAVSKDGLVFAGTLNSEILAVNTATGKLAWRKPLTGSLFAAPLLTNGSLFFGTDKSKVYILNPADGSEIKSVDAGGPIVGTPVYTKDAVVFVTEAGETFSLSLDGATKAWTRTVKGNLYSSPVVIGQQVIFSAYQGDHILGAYDFSGTADEKWNAVTLK